MAVGLTQSRKRVVTETMIEAFATLSGDRNPVHFDEDYAAGTVFGGVVAHGMLSASLLSGILGEELPGHGAIYLKQSLSFRAPVRPGDLVEAQVSVGAIDAETGRVTLDCLCRVGEKVVLDGQAIVLAPRKPAALAAA